MARTYDKIPALSALTSMFVHGGWLHLLGNMLFLWVFGNNVEDRFGRVRFLIFYLAVGMASAYGYALTRPGSTQHAGRRVGGDRGRARGLPGPVSSGPG